MTIDEKNWNPLQPIEVYNLFQPLNIQWWIAGGWAIDLFLGKKSREHLDIDVLILRKEQMIIQDHLKEWKLFKTNQPGLKPWEKGEFLEIGVNSIWCKKTIDSPWILEIMFLDVQDEDWFFRRNPKIRGSISDLGLQSESGIPYLKPEIQLLYKAKEIPLQKDMIDFHNVVPFLKIDVLLWLRNALLKQFNENHPWIEVLNTIQ